MRATGVMVRAWRPAVALVLLLLAAGVAMAYLTRGTTFWFDEWMWIAERRAWDLDALLRPHNGHMSLVPVAIYKVLFETVGLDQSWPYRAVLIALQLVLAALVYVYVSRRVGVWAALVATALLAFFGPGFQNLVWMFQITWLTSLAAGVGALLALERRDRAGDVAACALLGLALACSGLGIPIAAGAAVDVALTRRRLRAAWIVALPLALYALWWLAYQDYESHREVWGAPRFAFEAMATVASALVGLSGPLKSGTGEALGWGRPLAVLGVVALVWRLGALRPVPPRVWALLAVLGVFWVATGLERAGVGSPEASRYAHVSAVFVVLLVAELARGVRLSRAAAVVLALVAVAVFVSNLGHLRNGARYARDAGTLTRTGAGALEIARPVVGEDEVAQGILGYPLITVPADDYFEAVAAYGSPAASPDEIASSADGPRRRVDRELARLHRAAVVPASGELPSPGGAPALDGAVGGTATERDGCIAFERAPVGPPGETPAVALTLPPEGVLVRAGGGEAQVALRRFADSFGDPIARLAPGASGVLRLRPDADERPWHVQVTAEDDLTVCGLGAEPA